MTSRIPIRLVTTIVAALAIVAATAPLAGAGGHGIGYTEPGSTGYVPTKVSIPANLANLREPGSVGWVPSTGAVAATAAAGTDGLDWASALIGGAVVLGIGFVCAGALLAMRRRRGLAHA
jgi:hypothetical protein